MFCRLWKGLSQALYKRNYDLATDEKTAVEDAQRKLRQEREDKGDEWTPNFFHLAENGQDWEFNYHK